MKQNEFVLKIMPIQNGPEDIVNYLTSNYTIIVEASDIFGKFLVNKEITSLFPQLKQIGLEDLQNGYMAYSGSFDVKSLEFVLEKWGFILAESKKHHIVCNGGEVQCTIKNSEELKVHNKKMLIKTLSKKLNQAVEVENYEEAAKIRDEINSNTE